MKAIETIYRGSRFRSRLEARWAVAFDCLGMSWDYEPQGYVVSGKPYLPDFWLPQLSCFVEIKPTLPTSHFMGISILNQMDYPVLLVCGTPSREGCIAFCGDIGENSAGVGEHNAYIGFCSICHSAYLLVEGEDDREFMTNEDLQDTWHYACKCGRRVENKRHLNKAFSYAAMCRFEHGEHPKVFHAPSNYQLAT